MVENVDIIEFEDPSLRNLLSQTADDLRRKYFKQRKVNEKYLTKKTPIQKVLSVFLDVVCVALFVVGLVVCFSTINTTINGYMPNFAGYSNLVISSGSMVKSGYEIGDIVIVHSVDANSLNVNDKIAFYVYSPSYVNFDSSDVKDVSDQHNKTKYTLSFKQLFGFPTDEVKQAEQANCDIVFHHIAGIYEDQNGERWFKTYGSSNGSEDSWWINEKYVVGIQDESILAKSVVGLVGLASKQYGLLILGIPVAILIVSMMFSFLKNIQIAKLELDCVEEKRKITDEICVKNNVGFQMNKKTKFKILAQATDEQIDEYIKLLWKDGNAPDSVTKYYRRKKLLVSTNKQLLKLNRECEQMFKRGEKPKTIAAHYLKEKERIEAKSEEIRKRFKTAEKLKKKKEN